MPALLRQETKESLITTSKESALILLFEAVGTAMMTLLITNYYAQKMEGSTLVHIWSTEKAEDYTEDNKHY